MGERARQGVVLIAGLAATLVFAGCRAQSRYPGDQDAARWVGRPSPPSLAFQSADVQQRVAALNEKLGPAWYETRADVRPSVFAGYESPVVDQYEVITYDRQSTNGRHVTDHYQRVRYGRESGIVVR